MSATMFRCMCVQYIHILCECVHTEYFPLPVTTTSYRVRGEVIISLLTEVSAIFMIRFTCHLSSTQFFQMNNFNEFGDKTAYETMYIVYVHYLIYANHTPSVIARIRASGSKTGFIRRINSRETTHMLNVKETGAGWHS
jgi:hypothetical protein